MLSILRKPCFIALLVACAVISHAALAQQADNAWLRYEFVYRHASVLPAKILLLDNRALFATAARELSRATGAEISTLNGPLPESAFVLATWGEVRRLFPELRRHEKIGEGGFWLKALSRGESQYVLIVGDDGRGVLYGAFSLLERIAQRGNIFKLDEVSRPSAPIRWVTQWDNLDGSIERGYAGNSIFFENGRVKNDLTRAASYARLLASIGINGCVINNVNADPRLLRLEFLPQLKRVADAFRPYGVRLGLSVDLSSPMTNGSLSTFDPLDPLVAVWWRSRVDRIYREIPDFAGFEIKADVEGRSGPAQYGRSPADAANVIARALKPYGGVLMYRAFVYSHHLNWRDLKADRARAAYDYFHPLDGRFEDNVVLQIKYGPIDFQVREPASPLFGAMPHTNEAIELQVTQEYTGQQRHLCFLVPMWKEILDFDMQVRGASPVKDIITGKVWNRALSGYDAVANVGDDQYWLGHPLAMANLYGYGRLAWDPDLPAQQIAQEWSQLTFGTNSKVVETISAMLLASWHIYEGYTGPLGAGTMTDILGSHYGPGIDSSERNGWGQWHRADANGIGMDRTIATGTGFIGQYSPAVQELYEPLAHCPDKLLLFMHHVPYTYRLHSGKTVIQHIYDSHYDGAKQAASLVAQWRLLYGLVDESRYAEVLKRLQYQAGHAIVWRDAVVEWFHKMSGIADALDRVEHHPDRIEAESMQLIGYVPVSVTPWETASGGRAVVCTKQSQCSARTRFEGKAGNYEISVQYFDLSNGVSQYDFLVNDRVIDSWRADDHLPNDKMDGDTATRHVISSVRLVPGDYMSVVGHPGGEEPAPLDYLEFRERGTSSAIDGNAKARPH